MNALLNTHSYYSFGRGVASPTTLVKRAQELGYQAVALTDELSIAGFVEFAHAAAEHAITPLFGVSVPVAVGNETGQVVLLIQNNTGFTNVNTLITLALAREHEHVTLRELRRHHEGLLLLTGGRSGLIPRLLSAQRSEYAQRVLQALARSFDKRCYVQLFHDNYRWDDRRVRTLTRFAAQLGVPSVAAPEVRYATPETYQLYDALLCGRLGITVHDAHPARPQNDCQAVPTRTDFAARFPKPGNLASVVAATNFSPLAQRLVTPRALLPAPFTNANDYLRHRCERALPCKYPAASAAHERLQRELATIAELGLADFFLVAAEIIDFCHDNGILAAGRGSATGSITCYLLGISAVDPVAHDLLFERFLHTGITVTPDIDIDISSARRREVITWVEERFGASREAMVCNKITYRLPSAIHDLGRALGMPPELRQQLTHNLGRDYRGLRPPHIEPAIPALLEAGDTPAVRQLINLLRLMEPKHCRHLAPHSGGVVLTPGTLLAYSPVHTSTGGIRLLQLDKDDAEAMGLIKLDLLGLRMLSALENTYSEIERRTGERLVHGEFPNDEQVWELIAGGVTLGMFQIESPSQMNIARQLQPRSLLRLAHQIALIRPGPIQSGTVHPYLRRHQGLDPVQYWHPALEPILHESYGVLLFQEDILRIAVHFAGMGWVQADRFRKLVSDGRYLGNIEPWREAFISSAMAHTGATHAEAVRVFDAIRAFQGFGFAESHAWAFALHSYASAWLRVHYPAEFFVGIMNEQPGMWSDSTKQQEAFAWGVTINPIDINHSTLRWHTETTQKLAVRAPLAVSGVRTGWLSHIIAERNARGPFASLEQCRSRTGAPREVLAKLVRAGAFDTFGQRRALLYRVYELPETPGGELLDPPSNTPTLAPLAASEKLQWEHALSGVAADRTHAVDIVRSELEARGAFPLAQLGTLRKGMQVRTAGLVVSRQKPPTAKGFAFFILEDGTKRAQLVIPPTVWNEYRTVLRDAQLLLVDGIYQADGYQPIIKAERLYQVATPFAGRGYHYG